MSWIDKFSPEFISRRVKRVYDMERCFERQQHVPKKILDIGFGNGAILSYFASKGMYIAGIEISEKSVESASKKFPNGKFMCYDGINIPFEDDSFDTVILNDTANA